MTRNIFLFHRVSDRFADPWTVSHGFFRKFIEDRLENGMQFVSEDGEQETALTGETGILHFDDGYSVNRDCYEFLMEQDIPFSVFVVPGLAGDWNRWDFSRDLPVVSLMGFEELADLASTGLVTLGSHSMYHASLDLLPERVLADDLRKSRDVLEQKLQRGIETLSYPYGRFNDSVLEAAELCGYRRAYIVEPGMDPMKHGSDGNGTYRIARNEIREH